MATTTITKEIAQMVEMLPDSEQNLAYEMVKRLVLAWDPDFTKLTPAERKKLEQAEAAFTRGEYIDDKDIDWDNLDSMNLN